MLTRQAEIHNFVYDEEQIKRFMRLIGAESETHQIFLSIRPKYQSREEKEKDNRQIQEKQISPLIIHACTPEDYVGAIRKYELAVGSYTDRGEKVIPTEMMVIYGTTNPRDENKAAKKLAQELLLAGFERDQTYFTNLSSRLTSCMMSSKGKTNLITIDIDDKTTYTEVRNFLHERRIKIIVIETRGGYHVMFPPGKQTGDVFQKFSNLYTMGDIFCPIPGTYQGGFPVRFIDVDTDFP